MTNKKLESPTEGTKTYHATKDSEKAIRVIMDRRGINRSAAIRFAVCEVGAVIQICAKRG